MFDINISAIIVLSIFTKMLKLNNYVSTKLQIEFVKSFVSLIDFNNV